MTCGAFFVVVCFLFVYAFKYTTFIHAYLFFSCCLYVFLKNLRSLKNLRELNLADNNIERIGRFRTFLLLLLILIYFFAQCFIGRMENNHIF